MKKKLLAGLLATATTVSMMAAVPVFAEDAETIKIGTLYPLTGDVAAIGQNIMRGVEFAVNEINENGRVDGKQI